MHMVKVLVRQILIWGTEPRRVVDSSLPDYPPKARGSAPVQQAPEHPRTNRWRDGHPSSARIPEIDAHSVEVHARGVILVSVSLGAVARLETVHEARYIVAPAIVRSAESHSLYRHISPSW
jgi:hypothetical protein